MMRVPDFFFARVFLIMFFMIGHTAGAQPIFESAFTIPFIAVDGAVGPEGDLFLAGSFSEGIDIDQDGNDDLVSAGGSDVLIVRYTAEGVPVWAHSIRGSTPSAIHPTFGDLPSDVASSIAINDQGDLFVLGRFYHEADFNADDISDLVTSSPDTVGVFLARYDSQGNWIWARTFPGPSNQGARVVIDGASQTVYALFNYYDATTFSLQHIVALDYQGNTRWSTSSSSLLDQIWSQAIVSDLIPASDGTSFVTGWYRGTVDLDGEGSLAPLEPTDTVWRSDPSTTTYIAHLNAAGQFDWITTATGSGDDSTGRIMLDAEKSVYTLGNYRFGDMAFPAQDTVLFPSTFLGYNGFLARHTVDGNHVWSFPILLTPPVAFPAEVTLSNFAFDSARNVITFGSSRQHTDLDFDGIPEIILEGYEQSIFLASYSVDAGLNWHWNVLTPSGAVNLFSQNNSFHLLGWFDSELDLDGPGGVPPLHPIENNLGIFVARFTLPDPQLPVELTAFTALAAGDAVTLSWTTASETNNAGFDVQHRVDDDWETIAYVPGNGTSLNAHDYRHRIERLTLGRHAFRLRQVDFDGAFTFSAEVEATVAAGAALVLGEAYPNPFNPQTTFTVALARSGWVSVGLYDALGRRVRMLHEGPLEGETTHRFVVDGTGLPSGVYMVRAVGETHQASNRVLLVK